MSAALVELDLVLSVIDRRSRSLDSEIDLARAAKEEAEANFELLVEKRAALAELKCELADNLEIVRL